MALDWGNAVQGEDGSETAKLRYGNVGIKVYPHADRWEVLVEHTAAGETVTIHTDDVKQIDLDAGKLRAEVVYAQQSASWVLLDAVTNWAGLSTQPST